MGMTVQEALMEGLRTTVVGLAIVFGVLIILMLVLMLFKVIFYKEAPKAKKPEVQKVQQPKPAPASAPIKPAEDDTELIAVLTAAVAASLNTSTYNLRIKSYRRVDTNTNAWNKAGIRENTFNKTY